VELTKRPASAADPVACHRKRVFGATETLRPLPQVARGVRHADDDDAVGPLQGEGLGVGASKATLIRAYLSF